MIKKFDIANIGLGHDSANSNVRHIPWVHLKSLWNEKRSLGTGPQHSDSDWWIKACTSVKESQTMGVEGDAL